MNNILALDIGGTWVRSALYQGDGNLSCVEKTEACWANKKLIPEDIITEIMNNITNIYEKYNQFHLIKTISISLGACMNNMSGKLYFSAPIFGNQKIDFDFKESIQKKIPNVDVFVINDVTALCYGYDALGYGKDIEQFSALTISSGIALRRYDALRKKIFCDPVYGIQGEIGHLRVANPFFKWKNLPKCDCGGIAHFSAFSSGCGLENIFKCYAQEENKFSDTVLGCIYQKNGLAISAIKSALSLDSQSAREMLNIIAYPIAQAIAMLYSFCPETGRLFISGGVVESLGSYLIDKIFEFLPTVSYVYDKTFFIERIKFINQDINLGLIGAGFFSTLSSQEEVINH